MKHNWENYFDISSEYWLKVEKIYEENESFPKKVVKDRNLHHKFPRSFSKKEGEGVDNDEDNLVSLSLADHFRVHYYLWKSAKKGYRSMMAMAFTLMRKKAVVYATDETIEQIARDYEEAVKEVSEAKSKAMKGKPGPNKGKKFSEETRKKLSEAHKGKKLSEETRKKLSEGHKGKQAGEKHPMYGRHRSEETLKKISETMKGKPKSDGARRKMSAAKKGMRWFNNGEKCVRAKECPEGFVPGRIK